MEIRPYTKNAKKHPKKQIEQVANSIKEFGMNQPIVVDKRGVIIVGHGRYEALKHLGMPIKDEYIKVVDLTEEQANAYRLADNKLNESDWDMSLVIEELKGLSDEMLELTGFDKDLIIEPEEKDDEVPEAPEEPQSKLGDLYELGNHRVLCGDSTKLEDVERLMGGKKADMVFTDPPYGIALGFNETPEQAKARNRRTDGKVVVNDELQGEGLVEFLTTAFFNAGEYTKSGGAFNICSPIGAEVRKFIQAIENVGWHYQSGLVWNKSSLSLSRHDYHPKHEIIHYGWKGGAAHNWFSDRKQSTVMEFNKPSRSEAHPTMKPIELITYLTGNVTKGEDVILDLFLGSGSTLIASEKTGRICYGMELDPKYVDVIVQRYVDYTGNTEVIKNGEKIVWQK